MINYSYTYVLQSDCYYLQLHAWQRTLHW